MSTFRLLSIVSTMVASLATIHTNQAAAQVVQLPTFHFFSVDTTVLVPDRGSTYLGGVNYSSAGSTQRGIPGLGGRPFTNSAIGRSTGGGGMWVSAYIHDFDALEAQLLGQDKLSDNFIPGRGANVAINRTPSFAQSVAAIRTQANNEENAQQLEAQAYLKRAQEKLNEGQPGLAKIYFQMAERRSTGSIKDQALAGLKAIEKAKSPRTVAKQ